MRRPVLQTEVIGQIVRFCVVGAMNTLVGLLAIYLNMYVFGMSDVTANLCGYIFGLLFGFLFHRNWTFRARNRPFVGVVKYVVAFVIAYTVNIACVMGLLRLGVPSFWAQAGGVVPYVIIFFLLSRYMVFSEAISG